MFLDERCFLSTMPWITIRRYCCSVFVFVVTLTLVPCSATTFREGPSDTVLIEGKTAVLRCAVDNQGNEVVYWFHVDSGQYISYDENIYSFVMEDRYSIIGDHRKGEYFLTIRDARKSDKGEYRCVFGNQFMSSRVVVLVPPNNGSPSCEVLPAADTTTPGNVAQLTCTTQGGEPPAELSWYRQGKLVSGPTVHANTIQRLVETSDNGVLYTCSASTPALTYPRTCTVMVLKDPPRVDIYPTEVSIKHGESVQFTCRGIAEPNVTAFRWFVNYVIVGSKVSSPRYTLDTSNTTLTIHNVQAWENGVIVSCEASIPSGLKGRATANLAVKLPPNFKTNLPPNGAGKNKRGNHTRSSPNGLIPNPFLTSNIAAITGASAGALILLVATSVIAACCAKTKNNKYNHSNRNIPGSLRYKSSQQQILIGDDFPIYAKPMKVKRHNCEVREMSRPCSYLTTTSTAETAMMCVGSGRSDHGNGVAIPLCLRPPSLKRIGKKITSNYEKIGFDSPLPLTRPEPMGSEDNAPILPEGSARPADLCRSQNNATESDVADENPKKSELVYADLDLKTENNNHDNGSSGIQNSESVAYAKLRL